MRSHNCLKKSRKRNTFRPIRLCKCCSIQSHYLFLKGRLNLSLRENFKAKEGARKSFCGGDLYAVMDVFVARSRVFSHPVECSSRVRPLPTQRKVTNLRTRRKHIDPTNPNGNLWIRVKAPV